MTRLGSLPSPAREAESPKATAWHLWDVTVDGYGASIITAPTRGRALASAYQCDAFSHVSFRDFLKIVRVRRRTDPVPHDGYGYVRRTYGIDPQIGQRVTISGSGSSSEGKSGTVLYPGQSTAHVHVLIDGRDHPSVFHPSDIAINGRPVCSPAREAGGGR